MCWLRVGHFSTEAVATTTEDSFQRLPEVVTGDDTTLAVGIANMDDSESVTVPVPPTSVEDEDTSGDIVNDRAPRSGPKNRIGPMNQTGPDRSY
jgi:hypothetical protein